MQFFASKWRNMKIANTRNYWDDIQNTIRWAAEKNGTKLAYKDEKFAAILLERILEDAEGIDMPDLANRTNIPRIQLLNALNMLEALDLVSSEKTQKKANSPSVITIKPAENIKILIRENYHRQRPSVEEIKISIEKARNSRETKIEHDASLIVPLQKEEKIRDTKATPAEKIKTSMSIPGDARETKRGSATIITIPAQEKRIESHTENKINITGNKFAVPIIVNVGHTNEVRELLLKNQIIDLKKLFLKWRNIEYSQDSIKSLIFYFENRHKDLKFEITGSFPDCFIKNKA